MSNNGISTLQHVDLRAPYSAWLPTEWAMALGGFYQRVSTVYGPGGSVTNAGNTSNQVAVLPYADANGVTAPVGFADEEIDAMQESTDTLYNLTMGDEAGREVTLCLKGLLYLKNIGSTTLEAGSDIAAHPSGVQIANTISQTVIGKALMPIAQNMYGMVYVDLINARAITRATGW